ncbi:MAG TPA: aldo/keto reductase [Steroidobacteraceae bacterium]|nr:aldo/keto reductase [Steroidobacteraceae bacterium]
MSTIPLRQIGHTGLAVSEIGLGTGPLGNLYEPMRDEIARFLIDTAAKTGINYIDTAPFYGFGLSERRVGDGLRGRANMIISSKVGRLLVADPLVKNDDMRMGFRSAMPFKPVFDYSYDGILRSHEASLHRLGLAHIDIVYIHDIGQQTHGSLNDSMWDQLIRGGGLRALDKLRSEKSIRAFGVGVNEVPACLQVMEHALVDVVLLAGRYTLLEQQAMQTLFPACAAARVAVVVGAPYNSGILATGLRSGRVASYNYGPAPSDVLIKVQKIESICDRHAVPIAAAALQFPLAHPQVVSVVAGVASTAQLNTTLDNYNFSIPSDFWAELKSEGLVDMEAFVPSPTSRLRRDH